jgi:hypothetical protein
MVCEKLDLRGMVRRSTGAHDIVFVCALLQSSSELTSNFAYVSGDYIKHLKQVRQRLCGSYFNYFREIVVANTNVFFLQRKMQAKMKSK